MAAEFRIGGKLHACKSFTDRAAAFDCPSIRHLQDLNNYKTQAQLHL
jgi:hypothetical protein